jgi:hypothetical protein
LREIINGLALIMEVTIQIKETADSIARISLDTNGDTNEA